MAPVSSKVLRALLGLPFLGLGFFCFRLFDNTKTLEYLSPVLDSGNIEWDGGSIRILERFHYLKFWDEVFRGPTVVFAPSTLGYDDVARWHMISFLTDLGPIYAVLLLESCRVGNKFTPAYFPTIATVVAQILGIGVVGPVFYFLSLTFGPSASDLLRSARDRELQTEQVAFLLPIILVLHNAEIFAAYFAPSLVSRHYWTWAWQLAPLWIGVFNTAAARVASGSAASPRTTLACLGSISAAVWTYTLMCSPHPISELFLPQAGTPTDFVSHVRRSLQFDEIFGFAGCYLWLAYSFVDLRTAGARGPNLFALFALFPIFLLSIGPGATFSIGWYLRERALTRPQDKVVS